MWNGAGQREREQEAFIQIKNSLHDNATLAYYEVGAEAEVIVGASPVELDAMLTEKKRDGDRPITYLALLNRVTVRRDEKHWLFAGRASVYVCTWLEHG